MEGDFVMVRVALSPHAWGWTDWTVHVVLDATVVPTRVGVDRGQRWGSAA